MNVLIVKIAAIGDVVMALPLLTHLRKEHPKCRITWVCGAQVKPLLEAIGLVDHIFAIDETSLFQKGFLRRALALLKIWRQLLGKKYNLCLTLHPDPRYRWIAFAALCKERRFWNRKKGRMNPVPGRYHAHEALRLFTGNEGPEKASAVFPEIDPPIPPFLQDLALSDKPLIVLAPGGAKNPLADDALRRWPISSYAALMKSLSFAHLLVTGSESDGWVRDHLKSLSYTDLIGKLELLELIALLKKCSVLITHDSGPLHLAKLAKCPVVALFGPTAPSEKVGEGEQITVLWGGKDLACRPCYDGKTYAPCKRNLCLARIEPQEVLKAVLSYLEVAV